METIRVGKKIYSDPDVLSLIKATGSLVDPRSSVLSQARALVRKLALFEDVPGDPIKRLTILASMMGMVVKPMEMERQQKEKRDAILLTTQSTRTILYNPNRPTSRVAFSIAHEICHAFFPNSFKGVRFRAICESTSKEANELERLCDLGASEILMPIDAFQKEVGGRSSLSKVERLCTVFGSSVEATVFRLASAHPGVAVAGLLRYRLRVGEERQAKQPRQSFLFAQGQSEEEKTATPKYRRQSIHFSEVAKEHLMIRWNKSFAESSCVYQAGIGDGIHSAIETLPNGSGIEGRLEAIRAPFQREDAHPHFGDVLFFWTPDF